MANEEFKPDNLEKLLGFIEGAIPFSPIDYSAGDGKYSMVLRSKYIVEVTLEGNYSGKQCQPSIIISMGNNEKVDFSELIQSSFPQSKRIKDLVLKIAGEYAIKPLKKADDQAKIVLRGLDLLE